MIKQIKSSEVKKLLEENPKTVILDVRTNDELSSVGKINAEKLGSKTYHVVVSPDLGNWQLADPNFVRKVKKQIDKDTPILISCAAGGRSLIAANLLEQEGYTAMNLSDGFSRNGEDPGWKNAGLPSIIDS